MSTIPSRHWKKNQSTFKRQIGTLNEKEIEKKEEQHDLIQIPENKFKETNFDSEIEKQTRLGKDQKNILMQLWMKHEKLFQGKVGD